MKQSFIIGLFLLLSFLGFPQGENNNWYFGSHAGVTFNTVPPSALLDLGMLAPHCSSCVSDSLGNFLMETNGWYIYDRNHQIMPNGSGIYGNANSTQSVIFVKKPGEDSLYYLFSARRYYPPLSLGLFYSLVDLRLNNGLGDVAPGMKNIPIDGGGSVNKRLQVIRHHNNKDVWIVTFDTLNRYLAYFIDINGISNMPIISQSILEESDHLGQQVGVLKISQDGTKLVLVDGPDSLVEFCHFNDTTGVVTPLFTFCPVADSGIARPGIAAEFSTDGKLLYLVTNLLPGNIINICQYETTNTDSAGFVQSQIIIGTDQYSRGLQLSSNGKIYQCRSIFDYLNVIHNPNVKGSGCNYEINGIWLEGRRSDEALPGFLQIYKAFIHYTGQCQSDSVYFYGDIWPPADSIRWNFGDPASGAANYSNDTTPTHIYSQPGQYTVELYVRHMDNRTDTSWQTITIHETPAPELGTDTTICQGDSATFDAGLWPGCTYTWKELISGIQVGTGQTFTTGQPGNYEVLVSSANGCTDRDTVQLTVTMPPSVTNNPLSKDICSGESTNIALTSNVPGTTFSWTASLTSGTVTGFSADSGLVINQVLINTTALPGIVTYHITPKVGSCIGIMSDYAVSVNPGDFVKISISAPANNVCAGTSVTFIASPVNGGTNPSYQWKVNSVNSGTNSPIFIYTPNNGNLVQCVLTSSNTVCTSNNPATSNTITMIVNPNLPVSVSVTPSANPVCAGTLVTFTATPTYGGTTPSYQWKVNGGNVGTNNPVYIYVPANGDLVWCILTSSEVCTSNNPASSIQHLMVVNNNLPASVSISANPNPFCTGSSVTCTATLGNGGTNPVYQWKVNGVNVGINSPTYTFNPLNNDSVRCEMTSNLSCVSGNPATSNKIILSGTLAPIVTFIRCFDSITTLNAKPIKLKGGIPLGGIYVGPGVNNGYFYPNLAGAGTKNIIYSYTNAALCTASSSLSIINYPSSIFNCGNNLTDIRDNKVYSTLQLGSQCWMAADLDYGSQISETTHQRDNCVPEKYKSAVGSPQSAVYQWDEMMQYEDIPGLQGLCPPGWHVPTETDWNTLFSIWTNNGFAGAPLKYSGYSGFNALMSGVRHLNVQWDYQNVATFFWSSTPYGSYKAWAHGINDYDPSVAAYPSSRANAYSVRCLKDF